MDTSFLPNNMHLHSARDFHRTDAHLRRMAEQQYIYESPIIHQLPMDIPGIYNLGGGRQVGKTTLLKQWMLFLMKQKVKPEAIAFLSCELIADEKSLYRIVTDQLEDMPGDKMRYLILDEITYVSAWDKAIKYLADTGAFEQVVVVISGSDLIMMQEARMRFPGRRGKADVVDFHYYPLSFRDCLALKGKLPSEAMCLDPSASCIASVYEEFDRYLLHGGFLTAINECEMTGSIGQRTLATYSDWIRGDVIKRGKNEHYLREVLRAVIKHYASQISWRGFVDGLSFDHVQTAIDYMMVLESMDAIFIQSALIEDKLVAAPKKKKKFMVCDPFVFHAIRHWISPCEHPFETQMSSVLSDPKMCGALVEATVVTHVRRHYPTYYIKAESEVDVAYVDQDTFWPIEIKWTNQLRHKDLKQVLKYQNGQIWSKVQHPGKVGQTPCHMLPFALLAL